MAAVSYDSVAILAHFAERAGITFPLLSDPAYRTIDGFGIINTSVAEDDPFYGFPYSGWYIVDAEGVVKSKYFNERNNDRTTASNILAREFAELPDGVQGRVETDHLTLSWTASNDSVKPGQRICLLIDVDLKAGMHVYSPRVEGYIPIRWTMNEQEAVEVLEPEYPESRNLFLPAIDEKVPVYEKAFTVMRNFRPDGGQEFVPALRGLETIDLTGAFTYQACDDQECYAPVTIPMSWNFKLQPHDRTRVPKDIQRSVP